MYVLISEAVHGGLEVSAMYSPQQDVYRVIQLLPHLWFGCVHALLHVARCTVVCHFRQHGVKVPTLTSPAALRHELHQL